MFSSLSFFLLGFHRGWNFYNMDNDKVQEVRVAILYPQENVFGPRGDQIRVYPVCHYNRLIRVDKPTCKENKNVSTCRILTSRVDAKDTPLWLLTVFRFLKDVSSGQMVISTGEAFAGSIIWLFLNVGKKDENLEGMSRYSTGKQWGALDEWWLKQ